MLRVVLVVTDAFLKILALCILVSFSFFQCVETLFSRVIGSMTNQ